MLVVSDCTPKASRHLLAFVVRVFVQEALRDLRLDRLRLLLRLRRSLFAMLDG